MKARIVAVVTGCIFAVGAWAHGDEKAKDAHKAAKAQPRAEAKKDAHGGHEKGKPATKSDHGKKE